MKIDTETALGKNAGANLEIDLELCKAVGESADRLTSAQVFMSGGAAELTTRNITKELYEAARSLQSEPLSYLAAKALLQRLKPRDTVIITTGFFDPPSMIDESDGPVGAVHFARALCAMLDVTPVFLTEVANLSRMEALARAGGLDVVDLELARITPFKAAMMPLPIDYDRAVLETGRCMEQVRPAAFVAIEKPGPCPRGRYHTGVGLDVTDVVGKIDVFVECARASGALTIGFGDGGNEVGMGMILPAIEDVVPTGKVIGTGVKTDILVVSSIANWGAYAVEACLAAALHMPEAIHSADDERRLLNAAASNGFIDPVTGVANGWVDGTPPICSESVLELLRAMVELRLLRKARHSLMNFPRRWSERNDATKVLQVWAVRLSDDETRFFSNR